jgi:hypothetical protein
MPSFDYDFQRIPRLQSEFASDPAGDDNLALRRDSCEHGKTILPHVGFRRDSLRSLIFLAGRTVARRYRRSTRC